MYFFQVHIIYAGINNISVCDYVFLIGSVKVYVTVKFQL